MKYRIFSIVSVASILGIALSGCGQVIEATTVPPQHSSSVQSSASTPASVPSASTPSPSPHPSSTSVTSSSGSTAPAFNGTVSRVVTGPSGENPMPSGYRGVDGEIYQPTSDRLEESIAGRLKGNPFVLDFYLNSPNGLTIGITYNHHPVFFGAGPSPTFDVLNFTGDAVILGAPSASAYEGYNLVTGKVIVHNMAVLKGYSYIGVPSHMLGIPHSHYPVTIPSGS